MRQKITSVKVYLPNDLKTQLRMVAAKEGVSMSHVIQTMLYGYFRMAPAPDIEIPERVVKQELARQMEKPVRLKPVQRKLGLSK